MKKLLILLVSLGLALGCGGDMPTDTDGLSPNFGVAGNSGCATVRFTVAGVVFPDPIPVTGDLEGTFVGTFMGDQKFSGVTTANGGTVAWEITGGVLGPLTFETTFDNRNISTDRPGSPAAVNENSGRHRALSGVQKANLTYAGTFSAISFEIDHDYNGVICP